jgi:hypothetical protein
MAMRRICAVPRSGTTASESSTHAMTGGCAFAEIVNKDTTANPQALDWFVAFARARESQTGKAS